VHSPNVQAGPQCKKLLPGFVATEGLLGEHSFYDPRELFAMTGDNSEEGQAVDEALYALRALRNCLELKTSEPKAA